MVDISNLIFFFNSLCLLQLQRTKLLNGPGDVETGSTATIPQKKWLHFISPIFVQAFTLTFLAEWGDRSQLTTIVLAAREVSAAECPFFFCSPWAVCSWVKETKYPCVRCHIHTCYFIVLYLMSQLCRDVEINARRLCVLF